MSEISAIKNTPDISFIDRKTVDDVQREMIADFEDYMTRIDGRPVTLGRASAPAAKGVIPQLFLPGAAFSKQTKPPTMGRL